MSAFAYIGAALAEIAGCFAFWAWLRLDKSMWWLLPGLAAIAIFAFLLTLVEAEHAGPMGFGKCGDLSGWGLRNTLRSPRSVAT